MHMYNTVIYGKPIKIFNNFHSYSRVGIGGIKKKEKENENSRFPECLKK